MKEIEAKHILIPAGDGDFWFGLNFNMNLYNGCCHGCVYCDSRSSCYGIQDFDEVRVKKDVLKILENELRKKRTKGKVIGTGAACDHYNPFERKLEVTRRSLELIDKYGFGVVIITKSNLVVRDIDVLKRISGHDTAMVVFTITTANEELCKTIEPGSPSTLLRLQAMKELSEAGIITGVLLTPLLPFINDTEQNVTSILEMSAKAGAKFAYGHGFGVTLRDIQRDHFFDALDKSFPKMKRKYIEAFGNSYVCKSPNSDVLWKAFTAKCKELNLIYGMKEIAALGKKKKAEQLNFFD